MLLFCGLGGVLFFLVWRGLYLVIWVFVLLIVSVVFRWLIWSWVVVGWGCLSSNWCWKLGLGGGWFVCLDWVFVGYGCWLVRICWLRCWVVKVKVVVMWFWLCLGCCVGYWLGYLVGFGGCLVVVVDMGVLVICCFGGVLVWRCLFDNLGM